MLYISRIVTRSTYGVIDTDDNVETIASYNELKHFVKDLGIDIDGVTINGTYLKIEVANHSNSSKIAKLAMMTGVVLSVVDDTLTSISFNHNVKSCTIRLSDYCSSIGDYVLSRRNISFLTSDKKIVLVLDNDIDITGKSFSELYSFHNTLVVDITNYKSKKNINKLYKCVCNNSYLTEIGVGCFGIIDNDIIREKCNIGMRILKRGCQGLKYNTVTRSYDTFKRDDIKDLFLQDYEAVDDFLAKKLMNTAKQLSVADFTFKPSYTLYNLDSIFDTFLKAYKSNLDYFFDKSAIATLLRILSHTNLERQSYNLLCHYIRYFNRNVELRNYYIKFIGNVMHKIEALVSLR